MGRNYFTATAVIGMLLGVCLVGAVAAAATFYLIRHTEPKAAALAQQFPFTHAVESFTCPKGLTRIAEVRGVEDGFAPAGAEPARIDPRLLRNGHFADLASRANSAVRLRGYDEGGSDKSLVDHFAVPRGIVSGKLVMRIASGGRGSDNDGLRIGDLDYLSYGLNEQENRSYALDALWVTSHSVPLDDGSTLKSIDFSEIWNRPIETAKKASFADYLNRTGRITDIDLELGDDTKVDALALLACQMPAQAKGVTLSETREKPLGQDVSWLTCSLDPTQHGCDPFVGDRLCSAPGPMACYRDGSNNVLPNMRAIALDSTGYVGGEVRASVPVRGDQFAHLGDANAFCQQQFGPEWRVLSYHEGGGGQVISRSKIDPLTRLLVNIRDQQYGNCWDRDLKR